MLLANVYVSYSLSYSLERVRGVGKELLTILHELRRAFFVVLKASLAMLLAPQNVPVHSNTENASCICLNQGLFFSPDRSGTVLPPTQEQFVPIPNNGPPTRAFKISGIMRHCNSFMLAINLAVSVYIN